MSTSLLLDLLTQNIKLEEFEQWIAGSTTKVFLAVVVEEDLLFFLRFCKHNSIVYLC